MQIKRNDLKLNTVYWVCDLAMASGKTNNNVFELNPTMKNYHGEIVICFDSDYRAFTTKKEALNLSNKMIEDPMEMYRV